MSRRGRYSPINPVAQGAYVRCPGDGSGVKSAMVGDNAELLEQVARLWITPADVVADATYGRGMFWARLPGLPHHAFDRMTGQDLGALPLDDDSVDVLALDPPYRPSHGGGNRPMAGDAERVGRAYQLGGLDSVADILALYARGITEAARVLRPEGRILVKCQDLSYSSRLHLVSMDVLRLMVEAGFDLADQFVLVGKANMRSSQWSRQERARRNHSVLWVGVL